MKCLLLQIPVDGLGKRQHLKLLESSPTVTVKTLLNAIRKVGSGNVPDGKNCNTKASCLEFYLNLFYSSDRLESSTHVSTQDLVSKPQEGRFSCII